MCPNPVKKPRREYCSDECLQRRLVMTNSGYARALVFKRDHGVCAICRFDTEEFVVRFQLALMEDRRLGRSICTRCEAICVEFRCHECGGVARDHVPPTNRQPLLSELLSRGYTEATCTALIRAVASWDFPHLWEADHVIPVVEGGGQCDLTNYRTLCLPDHRQVSAALAGRLAKRRKVASRFPGAPPELRRS